MIDSTTAVDALSGAVLALRAADLDRLGGFDERFALYFEETDLLRRMKNASMHVLYVPKARCQHLYNQSAGAASVAAGELYADSERRYLQKWSGAFTARVLQRMRTVASVKPAAEVGASLVVPEDAVVEASPLASFETAAAAFPRSGTFEFPEDVWRSYRGLELHLAVRERRTGRRLSTYVRRRRE